MGNKAFFIEWFIKRLKIMNIWVISKNTPRGLKMIEVSTHSKYITEKDLLEWENSLKGSYLVKRFNNQSVSEWIEVKGWYTLFKSSDLISVSVFQRWGFL